MQKSHCKSPFLFVIALVLHALLFKAKPLYAAKTNQYLSNYPQVLDLFPNYGTGATGAGGIGHQATNGGVHYPSVNDPSALPTAAGVGGIYGGHGANVPYGTGAPKPPKPYKQQQNYGGVGGGMDFAAYGAGNAVPYGKPGKPPKIYAGAYGANPATGPVPSQYNNPQAYPTNMPPGQYGGNFMGNPAPYPQSMYTQQPLPPPQQQHYSDYNNPHNYVQHYATHQPQLQLHPGYGGVGVGGQLPYGPSSMSSIGHYPNQPYHNYPSNPYVWTVPNVYPMSQEQLLRKRLTQTDMYTRIQKQLPPACWNWQSCWHPQLQAIIASWPDISGHTRAAMLYQSLERAIRNKANADSTDLIEILTTLSNAEKRAVLGGSDFCGRMADHWELNGIGREYSYGRMHQKKSKYASIMWELCVKERDETNYVDQRRAMEQAGKLYAYFNERDKFQESIVIDMLTSTNFAQLQMVFNEYDRMAGYQNQLKHYLVDTMPKGDHFHQVVEAIVVNVRLGRPHFFARLMKKKLSKLLDYLSQNDADAHYDLRRIMVTRAQLDLGDIAEMFALTFRAKHYQGYYGLRDMLMAAKSMAHGYDTLQLDLYAKLLDVVVTVWEPMFAHSRTQTTHW